MNRTFVIADLHFGHRKLAEGEFGTRPWQTVEEHDNALVERWNATVGPFDTVYVLGDVAMKRSGLYQVERLQGHKRLVMGNHDNLKPFSWYTDLFERVYSTKSLDGICLSHVPVHPSCLNRASMRVNVHGHLHEKVVLGDFTQPKRGSDGCTLMIDPRYRCVSAEQVDYHPIDLEEVRASFGSFLS